MTPFHLALPVHDLQQARMFYTKAFDAKEGRAAERWVDFNFFGHQLSLHLDEHMGPITTSEVDGDKVPTRHFGTILPWEQWHQLREHLLTLEEPKICWLIKPKIRFKGKVGEQATMFLLDPSGNAIELKSFQDPTQLFAH
jgi:uncharacterized protein